MKSLHTASALIELGAGLGLLCCPSLSVTLLAGAAPEAPATVVVTRIAGAGLISLGLACWFARSDPRSRASRGLVAAMLCYNIAVAGILAYASLGDGLHGMALWPVAALHLMMSIWCVACLRAADRPGPPGV